MCHLRDDGSPSTFDGITIQLDSTRGLGPAPTSAGDDRVRVEARLEVPAHRVHEVQDRAVEGGAGDHLDAVAVALLHDVVVELADGIHPLQVLGGLAVALEEALDEPALVLLGTADGEHVGEHRELRPRRSAGRARCAPR